ncbi:MAG: hypothetical protein HFJ34_06160, partial [Clostridia bacterium]|nr:hypothetical protein [Clostridia bacterium]
MEDDKITLAVRVDRDLHRKIKMLAMQKGQYLKEYMIDLMINELKKEKQIRVYKQPERDQNYIYENGKRIELIEDEEEQYIPNDENIIEPENLENIEEGQAENTEIEENQEMQSENNEIEENQEIQNESIETEENQEM